MYGSLIQDRTRQEAEYEAPGTVYAVSGSKLPYSLGYPDEAAEHGFCAPLRPRYTVILNILIVGSEVARYFASGLAVNTSMYARVATSMSLTVLNQSTVHALLCA